MFPCPHCGKVVDVPSCKYDPGGARASLGCGTLILIAIIVAIFSGAGNDSDALRALQQEIQALEQRIDDNLAVQPEPGAEADPIEDNQ